MNTIPNPYVGPREFETDQILYGRDHELHQIEALLIAERIVLLYSPSGAGKTSLIKAGLIPRLSEQNFNVLPLIRVNLEPPREDELGLEFNRYVYSTIIALEESLLPNQRLSINEIIRVTLEEYLARRPRLKDSPISEVLIFDQFEEVLTVSATDREAKQVFFNQLGKALRNHDRWALFVMREDYIGAITPFVRPIPNRLNCTFRLDLLGPGEAKQAVQKPARAAGIDFSDDAAQKLVDDLCVIHIQNPDGTIEDQLGPYVEPVQLQVACYRLWEIHDPNRRSIDLVDISTVGDVDQSLADHYALSVKKTAQKSTVNERVIREWFESRLITMEGIRSQVLLGGESSGGLDNHAVRRLEDAHIIRSEKRGGATWFELAHDRLIDPIRADNRKWFAVNLNLFQQQAEVWGQQGKPESMLLRGTDLDKAENDARTILLTPDERDFLAACRKLRVQEKREIRRNRLMTLLAIGATIAMIVAGIFWVQANFAAKENAQLASENANIAANAMDRLLLAQTQLIDLRDGKNSYPRLALGIEAFNKLHDFESYQILWPSIYLFMPKVLYLKNNGGSIKTICYSRDGKTLISGNSDNTFQFWNVETGSQNNKIKLDSELITLLCSPDGQKIVVADNNGIISLWDIKTANKLLEIFNGGDINNIAMSPDSKSIVSGSKDGFIRLFDAITGKLKYITQHENSVSEVTFSPNGEQIASADVDGVVLIWNEKNNEINRLVTGTSELFLTYSPDSKWIVTGGKDGSIIIWDSQSGKKVNIVYHEKSITALNYSPDGNLLLTAGDDDQVLIWDTKSLVVKSTLNTYGAINSAEFSPDSQYFVAGGYSGYSQVYQIGETNLMGKARLIGVCSFPSEGQINKVIFSPDGTKIASASFDGTIIISSIITNSFYQNSQVWKINLNSNNNLLVTASQGGTAKIWDTKTGQDISNLKHRDSVNYAEFSPDGSYVVTASSDHTAEVWRTSDGKGILTIQHNDVVSIAKFSPDGKFVASSGWDGVVQIWQVNNATKVLDILNQARVNDFIFSPNGRWIITASDDHLVRVWDLNDRAEAVNFSLDAAITTIDITPESTYIIAGDENGNVVGWDTQLRQQTFLTNLKNSKIQKISISPDGKLMAAGNEGGNVCVWQIPQLKKILCFSAEKAIWDIIFSSSDFIIAASSDASVHIWDLNSLSEYGRFFYPGPVLSIDLSSDNKYLAASTTAGLSTLIIWKREDVVSEACYRLPRQLTKDEWKKYLGNIDYKPFCPIYLSKIK